MPVFSLTEEIIFPSVELAEKSGILAIYGDLRPDRLLAAYSKGIFPWYSDGEPIIWWSPDPRFVLYPGKIRVSRSMCKIMDSGLFEISADRAFREVITACGGRRRNGEGTWITPEMEEAYVLLHGMGYAHSVEAWDSEGLAGGLYGVSLGGIFFGESMFSKRSNASKAALIRLAEKLEALGFDLIDCQVHTRHLESMGAEFIPRADFSAIIKMSLGRETIMDRWGEIFTAGDNR